MFFFSVPDIVESVVLYFLPSVLRSQVYTFHSPLGHRDLSWGIIEVVLIFSAKLWAIEVPK